MFYKFLQISSVVIWALTLPPQRQQTPQTIHIPTTFLPSNNYLELQAASDRLGVMFVGLLQTSFLSEVKHVSGLVAQRLNWYWSPSRTAVCFHAFSTRTWWSSRDSAVLSARPTPACLLGPSARYLTRECPPWWWFMSVGGHRDNS